MVLCKFMVKLMEALAAYWLVIAVSDMVHLTSLLWTGIVLFFTAAIGGAIAGSRANRGRTSDGAGAGASGAVTPNTAASASSSNDPAQDTGTMDGKVKA